MMLNWLSMKTFNIKDYDFYRKLEHGDINWIIPEKILAFSSPYSTSSIIDGI